MLAACIWDFLVLEKFNSDHNLLGCYQEKQLEAEKKQHARSKINFGFSVEKEIQSHNRNGPWKIYLPPKSDTDNMQPRSFGGSAWKRRFRINEHTGCLQIFGGLSP